MYQRMRDPQDRPVVGWCERCGREIYQLQSARLCGSCREREERMTLKTLAEEYRQSAALLATRIEELNAQRRELCGARLEAMNRRVAELRQMHRQTLQTAEELEGYGRKSR